MTGIKKLPEEVLAFIGSHLDNKDILAAICSCRLLCKTLRHLLWRELTLPRRTGELLVTSAKVEENAQHVQRLEFRFSLPQDYYSIHYPSLYNITISHFPILDFCDLSYPLPTEDHDQLVCLLISSNPLVRELELCNPYLSPSRELFNALSRLQNPRRLTFFNVDFLRDGTSEFLWQACSLFEELDLGIDKTSYHDILKTLSFPCLKRLTLRLDDDMDADLDESYEGVDPALDEFMDWLIALRQLEALNLQAPYRGYLLPENFISALREKRWPRLESFRLKNVFQSDVVWASMFQWLPPLKEFWFDDCLFDDQGFVRLQENHFKTLRSLNVRQCVSFSSRMALSVLTGCVHLEEFRAPYLLASDLKNGDSANQDWACVGLKYLSLFVAREPDDSESNELVFKQLSRLHQLRKLFLDQWLSSTLSDELKELLTEKGSLQLRLDEGLGHLSTLKRLTTISLEDTEQNMRAEDVEWILKNWTSLKEIVSTLSEDEDTQTELDRMFCESGVSCDTASLFGSFRTN
ncbi:hypothetical protein EC991_004493 [Linnemannia zychae]|nr:hypothetical protein EC991_004493 [Linnemannia zychae]